MNNTESVLEINTNELKTEDITEDETLEKLNNIEKNIDEIDNLQNLDKVNESMANLINIIDNNINEKIETENLNNENLNLDNENLDNENLDNENLDNEKLDNEKLDNENSDDENLIINSENSDSDIDIDEEFDEMDSKDELKLELAMQSLKTWTVVNNIFARCKQTYNSVCDTNSEIVDASCGWYDVLAKTKYGKLLPFKKLKDYTKPSSYKKKLMGKY